MIIANRNDKQLDNCTPIFNYQMHDVRWNESYDES